MNYLKYIFLYFFISIYASYAQVAEIITDDPTIYRKTKETIKVAVVLPLTGKNSASGRSINESVSLIKKISEDIKLDSQFGSEFKLEVIRKDDACSEEKAVKIAKEIIDAKDILFVIGHYCSPATLAAAPLYAKAGIVQITPYSTEPSITEKGYDTLFRLAGRNDRYAEVTTKWLLEFKEKYRIGVMFSSESSFGRSTAMLVSNALRERTKAQNIRYVDLATQGIYVNKKYNKHIEYDLSHYENNLDGLLKKIKDDKINVIFFGGFYYDLTLDILKGIKKINPKMIIIGGPSLQNHAFWTQSEGYANKILFTLTKDVTRDISEKELNAIEKTRKFKQATDDYGIDEAKRLYGQEGSRNIFAENRIYKNRNDFMIKYFKEFKKFPDLYISHLYASFEIIKSIVVDDDDNVKLIKSFKKAKTTTKKRLLGLEVANYMKNKGFGTSEEYTGFRTILGVVNFSEVGEWQNAEYTIYQWRNIQQERNWLFDEKNRSIENTKQNKFIGVQGDFKKLF